MHTGPLINWYRMSVNAFNDNVDLLFSIKALFSVRLTVESLLNIGEDAMRIAPWHSNTCDCS